MPSSKPLVALLLVATVSQMAYGSALSPHRHSKRPNIILILADDLGYGDVGFMGQKKIRTPNLDRMAREGVIFTNAYAPSPLCAPTRCSIMTGYDEGHNLLRGNSDGPLRPQDLTMAMVLKDAGYDTAIIGKWGLGNHDNAGAPTKKGFDYFFGYMTHIEAHNYYPPFMWNGLTQVPLKGNKLVRPYVSNPKVTYGPNELVYKALNYISKKRSKPFFLYFPLNLPHVNWEATPGQQLEVPNVKPYEHKRWNPLDKRYAAMVTRIDTYTAMIVRRLKQKHLDKNTIIVFSSDNGPYLSEGDHLKFFKSAGPFRGYKRSLYEGGVRMPLFVYGPGLVASGRTVDAPVALWDLFQTFADIAHAKAPKTDAWSWWPLVKKSPVAPSAAWYSRPLYFEIYSDLKRDFAQSLRIGKFKAIRPEIGSPFELYDLARDPGEKNDIAKGNPKRLASMVALLKTMRTPPQKGYDPFAVKRKSSKAGSGAG